jgi:hypothetical protein
VRPKRIDKLLCLLVVCFDVEPLPDDILGGELYDASGQGVVTPGVQTLFEYFSAVVVKAISLAVVIPASANKKGVVGFAY